MHAVSATGELVTLADQDRSAWDRDLVAEGHALVRARLATGERPGRYQLLAAVNAVHTDSPSAADTDWAQIAALYSQLYAVVPSPIVALNRAVAVAELDGAAVALAQVVPLEPALAAYHPFHVTRAELLRRLGRDDEARASYRRAWELSDEGAERRFLERRLAELGRRRLVDA